MPSGCADGRLRPTGESRSRGAVVLRRDAFGVTSSEPTTLLIAVAKCSACGRRTRVLPIDVLPRKTYALPVIESLCARYASGGSSLREVAWNQHGGRTPSHTTLWAWTEGLGAFALGREAAPASPPASRLYSETAARRPDVRTTPDPGRRVDERRYRSEGRRERLAAAADLLEIARGATGAGSPDALTRWRAEAASWPSVGAFSFRTAKSHTAMEHAPSKSRRRSPAASRTPSSPCPTRNKSPPPASSGSPRS